MNPAADLPGADAVARLLRDLFGKAVTPKPGTPPPSALKVFAGTYVDDTGKIVGVCICDLPLGASMGSALALIAPGAAADAARTGTLSPEMFDNLREVLNIVASLFGGPHVRFGDICQPSTPLPPQAAAIVARPRARLDLMLNVTGYSAGRFSMMIA